MSKIKELLCSIHKMLSNWAHLVTTDESNIPIIISTQSFV